MILCQFGREENVAIWVMDMLWFNFFLGLNFNFLCLKLIIIHYHTQKQRKIKFKPRKKLNHNRYIRVKERGWRRQEKERKIIFYLPYPFCFLTLIQMPSYIEFNLVVTYGKKRPVCPDKRRCLHCSLTST